MQKLVAVMYTDIVGYTSITDYDDQLALRLNEKHKNAVTEQVEKFSGVLQEVIGDGSLSYFDSASDCVNCAIALQNIFQVDPLVPVRFGIHVGEIKGDSNQVF